ncbi:UDP-glucose 4-epimerase [Thelohanellus kitauei]|uniref:UDP-glucose 4-epimerase n=1 Tax=Thelohanellus kitauei TaxID=669202 RepID=A0A0C2IEH0_THEKT|nr:UDP-glucose 4-epimerase [Thelohanellus kitauei]
MELSGITKIVYSSSSTVYGNPHYLPLDELHPTGDCVNPYGFSKYVNEIIIRDHMKQTNGSYIHLRYFNPVGAHKSGIIGESPMGIPNNLFPYVSDVAVGKRECLSVFGDKYMTADGTGARDYIHVVDLANGHVKAVQYIISHEKVDKVYNLGTGTFYTVLQVVRAYEKACGRKIKYQIVGNREGDIDINYADPTLAKQELGWSAQYHIDDMCADAWRFIKSQTL